MSTGNINPLSLTTASDSTNYKITSNSIGGTSLSLLFKTILDVEKFSAITYSLVSPVSSTLVGAAQSGITDLTVSFYTPAGALLSSTILTALPQQLFEMVAYEEYNMVVSNGGLIVGGTDAFYMDSFITPNTLYFFNDGIQNTSDLSGVVATTDSLGSVTWTFTNVPITTNSQYVLGNAQIAVQSGALNVTSSDPTVFASYVQLFNPQNSILIALTGLKNTSFTGTVKAAVDSVGVLTKIKLTANGKSNLSSTGSVYQKKTKLQEYVLPPGIERLDNEINTTKRLASIHRQ